MKRYSFYTLIGSLIALIMATSCASFPKRQFSSFSNIKSDNINSMEGTYALKHCYPVYLKDSIIDMTFINEDLNRYPTLFDEVNNGVFVKRLDMYSGKNYTFSLKILSPKRIEINYFEDDHIIRKNKIRYKLKEDGFVYIKHRNFKIIGIPYVFGGLRKKRSRLTLNEDGNLFLETSEFRSEGVFYPGFIVPAIDFASKSKYKKVYERIN